MIDAGILKILLKNLVKENVMLQTKCFEVLLHFDSKKLKYCLFIFLISYSSRRND